MDEWFNERECSLYSFWLVASLPQRFEHLVASMGYDHGFGGVNTYRYCHCTVAKYEQLFSGNGAFALVVESIKRWHKKYGSITRRYSIIIHGRHGAPKGHIKYMLGCYIDYISDNEIKITHIDRKVPAFVAMIRSSRFYGGVFKQEQPTQEEAFANARKRMLIKRVMSSNRF
jgi:hypothetical protein